MTAFYLVATDHAWVVANPKETELTYVRPGQAALVTVDTYPDTQWRGAVESVSPAAAQEFSLLPAQNTQRQLGEGCPAHSDAGASRHER